MGLTGMLRSRILTAITIRALAVSVHYFCELLMQQNESLVHNHTSDNSCWSQVPNIELVAMKTGKGGFFGVTNRMQQVQTTSIFSDFCL